MDCVGPNPNADLFVCTPEGGWVPANHPSAPAPPPTAASDLAPPAVDEYQDGLLARTANPAYWFRDGQTYRHPYGYVVRVEGIALRNLDGVWRWSQRLVLIESSGDPVVGTVLYARLFAPANPWYLVEE